MRTTLVIRIVGLLIFGSIGAALGIQIVQIPVIPETIHIYVTILSALVGGVLGFIFTPWITLKPFNRLRRAIQQLPADIIFSATVGLFLGLALGAIAAYPLSLLPRPIGQFLPFIVAAAFGYIGLMSTTMRPDLLQSLRGRIFPKEATVAEAPVEECKPAVLLDTSVIIDGRIADICRTGFIQGELVVPLLYSTNCNTSPIPPMHCGAIVVGAVWKSCDSYRKSLRYPFDLPMLTSPMSVKWMTS